MTFFLSPDAILPILNKASKASKASKAKKTKKKRKKKDPNAPKRNKNGYMFFTAEKRGAVTKANPTFKIGDIAKHIGALWRGMTDEEKEPYSTMASQDKIRYTKALKEYKALPQVG